MSATLIACPRCGGAGIEHNVALSRWFRYSEVTATEHRSAPNDPDEATLIRLRRHLAECADVLRDRVGRALLCTSGYRSPGIGGVDWFVAGDRPSPSAHSDGTATDLVGVAPEITPRVLLEEWLSTGAPFDQAILERGRLHLSAAAPRAHGEWVQRKQALVRVRSRVWLEWHGAGEPWPEPAAKWGYVEWAPTIEDSRVA